MTKNSPSATGELGKEVFGLRFANATGELDNTAGLGRARRDLARALTVARERELTAEPTAGQLTSSGQDERTEWLTNQTRDPRDSAGRPRGRGPRSRGQPEADAEPRQPEAERLRGSRTR